MSLSEIAIFFLGYAGISFPCGVVAYIMSGVARSGVVGSMRWTFQDIFKEGIRKSFLTTMPFFALGGFMLVIATVGLAEEVFCSKSEASGEKAS